MKLETGQAAEVTRRYTAEDVAAYVRLGGHAPAGEEVPEPLIDALFSCLLGVDLPGSGTCYLKQETRFDRAAQIGEHLRARVEVTRIRPDKHLVDLRTTCVNDRDERICDGRALVYVRDVQSYKDCVASGRSAD